MELIEVIKARRSIRKYQDRPVEREKINACLEAARLAPSACNSQPWHYIVIDDPKTKEAFCKEAFGGVYAMTKFAEKAPVLVAAVSDRGSFCDFYEVITVDCLELKGCDSLAKLDLFTEHKHVVVKITIE